MEGVSKARTDRWARRLQSCAVMHGAAASQLAHLCPMFCGEGACDYAYAAESDLSRKGRCAKHRFAPVWFPSKRWLAMGEDAKRKSQEHGELVANAPTALLAVRSGMGGDRTALAKAAVRTTPDG
jgi:hypothetical protein